MKDTTVFQNPDFLKDDLWRNSAFAGRARDVSPLYINRYSGPRTLQCVSSHKYWEFTCVLQGAGVLIGARTIALQKYAVCLIPPGFMHGEQSAEGMDTIWIGFECSRKRLKKENSLTWVQNKRLCDLFEQIWLLAECGSGTIGLELDGMFRAITGNYLRLLAGGMVEQNADCMERAIYYFNEHFAEALFVPQIARHFGYSEGYFQRTFKRKTGLTPVAYLTTVRCRHAAHLLEETNWSIARIAEMTGYNDQFYFSRNFRKIYGRGPREYRGKILKEPSLNISAAR